MKSRMWFQPPLAMSTFALADPNVLITRGEQAAEAADDTQEKTDSRLAVAHNKGLGVVGGAIEFDECQSRFNPKDGAK